MSTTIGSLSSSTANSIRGYGGLASGMDRDSLIEGMTYGTTSKITQQQQKKQQLEWKQAAVRSITDLMVSFANKYTSSWSSKTHLLSSTFWGRSNIKTTGANSKFVSVSGTATAANSISIMGVKQLAQKAKYSSQSEVSTKALQTGEISTADTTVENLVGKKISIEYGSKTYSVYLSATAKDGTELHYNTAQDVADSINKLLAEEDIGNNKTLADIIKVQKNDRANGTDTDEIITFSKSNDDTNKCQITGGDALNYLGFAEPKKDDEAITIKTEADGGTSSTGKVSDLLRDVSFAEKIAGKELTFNYNGKTATIKIPSEEELTKAGADGTVDVLANLQASLQTEMNKAFGKDRVKVELTGDNNNKLSFETMNPTGGKDNTSTLTLVSGDTALVGKNGALNVAFGESNRLNLNAKLEESGLKLPAGTLSAQGTKIKINGVDIEVTNKDTVYTLMEKINDSDAGVTVSYQEAADKFVFTSKEDGASGTIDFTGNDQAGADLLNAIFGAGTSDQTVMGQDAIVAVKYAGTDETVELTRGSNSFTIDGLTISVKGEFGYLKDADGKTLDELDPSSEEVGIEASVNSDSIVDAVKTMIEEYNAIIELVNKELSTKPDRSYTPLTSEQKKELSEDEIKLYEEKAKSGLLFGDSDLRTLSSDLRFIIGGGNAQALENIGISTSSTYSDNGKLTFDESKFRAALESDPESVEKLFTDKGTVDERGNTTYGLATNLEKVMDKYVKTLGSWETKGILIRKAGSESSPLSITENFMYKEIAEIDKMITKLQARLESERDRYIKQFTSLESLISQMNSQSSYLSQFGGGY